MKKPTPLQPGSLVAAYIRDSGGAEQEMSEAQQEAVVRAFCSQNGYILTRIFKDTRSGSSTAGRTGFEEMIDAMRHDPREQAVIIWKMSRFARDLTDARYFKADLRRRGIQIVSLQDNLPAGPEGALVENILDWANARYLADLSSDVKRGKRHIVHAYGAWIGGRPPVGYKLEPFVIGNHRDGSPHQVSRLTIDEEKAPLIAKAFELRGRGATYKEIHEATHLLTQHISYQLLLNREIYTGRYQGIEDYCPAIISREAWHAAQAVNKARRERVSHNQPRSVHTHYWLSGLLVCEQCGSPYTTKTSHFRGKAHYYYVCSRRLHRPPKCSAAWINKAALEKVVTFQIVARVLTPEVINDLLAEAQEIAGNAEAEHAEKRRNITSQLATVRTEMSHIVSAIAAAGHSQALLDRLAQLEETQHVLNMQLAEPVDAFRVPDIDPETFVESAVDVLQNGEDQDRAAIARGLITRIILTPRPMSGKIYFTFAGADEKSMCF